MWVCNEDGDGLGVLPEAIIGVLTGDGEGLGVLTEAIDGALPEDGLGISQRMEKGWGSSQRP